MENIIKFYKLYDCPRVLLNQLIYSIGSPEHPKFHPEGTLEKHIDIVIGRTWGQTVELQFAAILHDITKSGYCPPLWEGRKGKMKKTDNGDYWQNVHHHYQAADFMKIHEVREWIEKYCDFDTVFAVVVNHMRMKTYILGEKNQKYGMKESKRKALKNSFDSKVWDQMYYFSTVCDNMLC